MDTNYGAVLCPLDRPLLVEGSEGNDRLSVYDDDTDAVPMTIHGNGGNDEIKDAFGGNAGRVLTGGPGNDIVLGYHGNDTIDGGDGNDEVDGHDGNDQVRGGAGDDVMWGDHYYGPGADLLDGGPGTDTTEEWGIPSDLDRQPRVNVTLDGAANDGRPGEVDNIDCGIGTDQAIVDTIDVVANCENVGAAEPQAGAVAFKVTRTKLGALAKQGLTVAVTCPSACKASGTLLLGGNKVGSGRAQGTGTVSVKLKLDARASAASSASARRT